MFPERMHFQKNRKSDFIISRSDHSTNQLVDLTLSISAISSFNEMRGLDKQTVKIGPNLVIKYKPSSQIRRWGC
jgi:hypothetical protein